MPLAPIYLPPPAGGGKLAAARERFLTAEPVEPNQVRAAILASWWRSRNWHVAADHIKLDYVRDPNLETPLIRSAMPVLRNLREHLDGQPISIILTDQAGVVLSRLVADHDLQRHLDGVQLAPGFSYAEASVGTNGIGTALEGGRPMHVFGHEHYAENLEDLGCAAVPIHHPISGKTIGAVDLTCWRRDAGPLLISLAKTTADQIRQALLIDGGIREFELLQEYLRACRRSAGIVFAFNHDMVMLNEYARQILDPGDQSVLLGRAAEALLSPHRGAVVVDLPTGVEARMYCRPVREDNPAAGGVVHVKLMAPVGQQTAQAAMATRLILPGLVGAGPLWLRGCHQVDAAYDSGEWLALRGEPGVGKLAVVRSVYQRRHPGGRLRVLDPAEPDWLSRARRELAEYEVALVVRHVDQLNPRQLEALATVLREAVAAGRPDAPWVVVTLGNGPDSRELVDLLRLFPGTVELPPLRHHSEDLAELVPVFLARLSQDDRLVCTPEAMQLLMRSSWPGNVEQLWQVLKRVVQRRRTGAIQPDDLPPECRTVSRRLLSPLESMERDAIVQSLADMSGNKARAAKALGMSRATIYRKIREYGIVGPPA
ncbi:MAG: sigma-54 dependent transcriptional regulator, acetoin dehydrogenase operon transcriptional [Micromonosporaceae bacterium]|jgi:transcriptional regulator of acetoin/glycerol metabolism